MAKLSFFRGAITGKLGEFVGSKWKGINYLRMHAKPSNPRTEGQISVRKVFSAISKFASALFEKGITDLIPSAKKMTERNSVFKANKQMFTDKSFVPSALQVCKANHPAVCSTMNCAVSGDVLEYGTKVSIPPNVSKIGLTLYAFVYDFVKGVIFEL
jgi:hypothetical protein